MEKAKVKEELINLLRKVEGFAYVRVSEVADDLDVPVRMHDEEEFARLKESIKTEGIIIPLILLKRKERSGYILVDGRNRLKAAKELGLKEVPALIYSYEGYDDDLKIEEAKYLAIVLEQARRHLSQKELEEIIKNTSLYLRKVLSSRYEVCKSVLGSLKDVFADEFDETKDDEEEKLLKLKEAYEEEIRKKNEEIEELKRQIEEYDKQISFLRESLEKLESREEDVFLDAKYFSAEVDELSEEEREKIVREVEERERERYLAQLKEYEKMMRDLKETLDKKENEVKMLNEKLKLVFKRTEEVKRVLGEVIGLNALLKKAELLLEEAKGMDHILFELVTVNLSYTDEEWKAFYEKWKEVKSYLDYIDKKVEETLMICNPKADEFELLEKDETIQKLKKLNKLEEIKKSKQKTFF